MDDPIRDVVSHGTEVVDVDTGLVFVVPTHSELDHVAAAVWEPRLLAHAHFELPDHFGSVYFDLPLFLGKAVGNFMVNIVPLVNDGVCEIFAPLYDIDVILFLTGNSFAKVVEMVVDLLRFSRFEHIAILPLDSLAVERFPERTNFLPMLEVEEPMLVGVVVVFTSLADGEMRLAQIPKGIKDAGLAG